MILGFFVFEGAILKDLRLWGVFKQIIFFLSMSTQEVEASGEVKAKHELCSAPLWKAEHLVTFFTGVFACLESNWSCAHEYLRL